MEKIQLVLVDDELSSRNTIKKYLEENDIYEIIADFKNGKTALDWLKKFEMDVWYVDHVSFMLDLKIFFLAIKTVFEREGISKEGEATTVPFDGTN